LPIIFEVSKMRIRTQGKITEGLWCLGRKESCVYLLEGEKESMMINAGTVYLIPLLLQQFKEFGIDASRISKLLFLHSHFDHLGTAPFFKRQNPDLKLYGSQKAWRLLSMPKVLNAINDAGQKAAERMGLETLFKDYPAAWGDDIKGTAISGGDSLAIEPFDGQILETPGHSICSISYYVPALRALFPSDAGGIPYGDTILAAGNSHFTQYQKSLKRLNELAVDYLCADHYGYITGSEAGNYVGESIQAAGKRRREFMRVYHRTGNIDETARLLIEMFYEKHPDYFLSPDILTGIFRQMVRHMAAKKKAGNTLD
jgi:glyoxylase-like metal-dependent hydrolase (beta-lactamase superfamily II)